MIVVFGLTLIGGSGRSAERGEIKPEFRRDLPPLGLSFPTFTWEFPCPPRGKNSLLPSPH